MTKAGKKEWIGLAVIALPCVLYSMDLTVLNLALPHMAADLKPSSSELLWIIDIYGFMVAGFLITMGTLGDRIGRRKLLLIGAVAFGVASVFAAYANSTWMLITARALLGIAGATLAPSTLSLIRNMFHDPKQRAVAIGVWVTSYSAGAAIGPLIGGTILQYFSWGAVFLIAIPVMLLLLILGPFLLPEYRDPAAGRIDLPSTFLSIVAVLFVIYGLKKIAENGIEWWPVVSIITGVITGMFFLDRQKKLADPLIDLKLFKSFYFSSSLVMYTLATFVVFASFTFVYQYMQVVAGLSAFQSGLWSLPIFCAFILGSQLAPRIAHRFHPFKIITAGLIIASGGFLLVAGVSINSGLIVLVTGAFIYCLGLAPVFTLATDIIVSAAPPERVGAASAISETGSEFGGAVGIAILGSVGTFIFRNGMTDAMGTRIPPDIAFSAKQTLSAAVMEAGKLPPEQSHLLVNAAKDSFVTAMNFSAFSCAIIVLLMAVLMWLRMKRESKRS